MTDIELVIKIPEEIYRHAKDGSEDSNDEWNAMRAIANSIPLPKGHGRIGDLDKVAEKLEELRDGWDYYAGAFDNGIFTGYDHSLDEVMGAPTIIEADGKGSD